ncbi:hypothetical protein ACFWOJ_28745 [Streptomyces sp. NPDC058439]|uniref:hypothetical protein n=1 Tax=Streptomyces sp. NPDC058439 TaxID=3346500 RepID=UPI003654EE9E
MKLLGPGHAACPAEGSVDRPAAVVQRLAAGRPGHLAPDLPRRGEKRDQRYGVGGARAEAGARGAPVAPLLRQRVDLVGLGCPAIMDTPRVWARPRSRIAAGRRYGFGHG